ncbi:MAG: methionyl-tRNA formyltransferase [Verrucomicrobiota bacterium]|nr:methionyl-tRNA formyltransferase [Verrucomicrobiota bacterium]
MRVVFIGTGEIGVPALQWLLATPEHQLVGVVTQPDKPVGRAQRIQAPPIKAAVSQRDVPVLQPERIKRPEAISQIAALGPQAIVVMAYGQILPKAVLEIPSVACLNLHASLLPKHRGAAPIQAAILAGDCETGLTVMYMDEGLDTGDILSEWAITIAADETGGSLHDRLAAVAPAALASALAQLSAGTAPRVPQDSSQATYAAKLEREHGEIDWNAPAGAIERKIRAFNPWPGSYTNVRGSDAKEKKLKIFSAALFPHAKLSPGEARLSKIDGIIIGAGDGALQLREVQLEGKKRMSAADLVRGHPDLTRSRV